MNLKYVIVDVAGNEIPVIFPDLLAHADMAYGMKVISAGFCQIGVAKNNLVVCCFGHSTSCKVKARPEEDEALILRELERHKRSW